MACSCIAIYHIPTPATEWTRKTFPFSCLFINWQRSRAKNMFCTLCMCLAVAKTHTNGSREISSESMSLHITPRRTKTKLGDVKPALFFNNTQSLTDEPLIKSMVYLNCFSRHSKASVASNNTWTYQYGTVSGWIWQIIILLLKRSAQYSNKVMRETPSIRICPALNITKQIWHWFISILVIVSNWLQKLSDVRCCHTDDGNMFSANDINAKIVNVRCIYMWSEDDDIQQHSLLFWPVVRFQRDFWSIRLRLLNKSNSYGGKSNWKTRIIYSPKTNKHH